MPRPKKKPNYNPSQVVQISAVADAFGFYDDKVDETRSECRDSGVWNHGFESQEASNYSWGVFHSVVSLDSRVGSGWV